MTLYSLTSSDLEPIREDPDEIEVAELRERVELELGQLTRRERDALDAWARVSGESCRRVAERYKVSPQTVCNWAHSAIDKLRPRLEAYR